MSSGRVHSSVTILAAAASTWWMFRSGTPSSIIFPFAAGCLTGLLVTPDLDVNQGSISQRTVRQSAGCLPGLIWSLIWMPYSRLISHRSPLSHWPILGTALRLVYLALIYHLVWYGLHLTIGLAPLASHTGPIGLPVWAIPAISGLVLSDNLHWIFDYLIVIRSTHNDRAGWQAHPQQTPRRGLRWF